MTVSRTTSRRTSSGGTLDWVAVGLAGAVVLASLALAGWVLHRGRSGGATPEASAATTALPRLSATQAGAPSVLSDRFSGLPLAGHDRDLLVGLGAHRGGPLDVVVIPSDEGDVSPADVTVGVGSIRAAGKEATSCGNRCLRFPLRVLAGAPSRVTVTVERPGKPRATVTLAVPGRLPAAADRLYAAARRKMFTLRTLRMSESLGSGLAPAVVSQWSFQAPDRLQYTIAGGSKAVVIGPSRWDWEDGRWTRSATSPITFPTYSWEGARGARDLGRARLGGVPVRVLAAMRPGAEFPTWFRLYVTDDERILRMAMQTTGHFMVDTYDAFDSAPPIRPPS